MSLTKGKAFGILIFIIIAAVGFSILLSIGDKTVRRNIVPNPSFEEMEGDTVRAWETRNWQKGAQFVVDTVARTGEQSLMITSDEGADASWSAVVAVLPYSRYRLTGWIKTDNLNAGTGRGALLNLQGIDKGRTSPVTGTSDWTRVDMEFETEGRDAVQINCLFGGWGKSTGTAWYDDLELDLLETREMKPEVTISGENIGEPISPYIYGQFIEHLGRCIYGGIWAEMLEDRKFFYDIGAEESPWILTGEPSSLEMDTTRPFVGDHSPVLNLKGTADGLTQGELALLQGKKYTGRIVLAADSGVKEVRICLAWGDSETERETISLKDLKSGYSTYPLSFTAGEETDSGRLEISGTGTGMLRIGTVSLMPADNIDGFRPEVLALLRELDAPVYRWPGGNFVSGYDWRDGIGDRDRRPPRKNPAWKGIEPNDVGIHEFLDFCRLIDTEPFIAVNSGLGDVRSAADEVEYVNGGPNTPQGQVRAGNGHPEPFSCRFWSIGNEMYGNWQLGHMPLSDYVKKHNLFAEAMRTVDPSIRLIAVGAVGEWSRAMLAECAGHMDFISEHFYRQEAPGLMSHVFQIPQSVRRIAEAHREYRKTIPALEGRDIRIALDEWNYWYGPHIYGELGVRYFLKDALGIAAGLHEYFRQSDIIYMANYAQTVNVIGAIKTSKTEATFATTGLALKLYRNHFGTIPLRLEGAAAPLDAAAAWKEKGVSLTLAVVNPTNTGQTLSLIFKDMSLPELNRLWRISGSDPMAYNEPGKPPAVSIQEVEGENFSEKLTVPPLSISLYELKVPKK
ncbi:MAG: alpha-L-arabinofuranosidase [Acidobacteria bacterium]|nr:alpha-L-arabinofuranosidase [Acidobacteriota bacterium]